MRILLLFLFVFLTSCGQQPEDIRTEQHRPPYQDLKANILLKQRHFREQYATATPNQKKQLRNAARLFVFQSITADIFPYWYGTPWGFYGRTTEPGKGKIACGYFVNTVLFDAGFDIPIARWSQLASEEFIVKLTKNLKRYRNVPVGTVAADMTAGSDGLYLVGLDRHVGFICVKGNDITFVHSNYYQKEIGVMAERLDTRNPLRDPKYRVIGKLLGDEMMEHWITGRAYN